MKTHLTMSMFAALFVLCAITAAAQQPELVVQTGHSGFIKSVAFSADGKLLASSEILDKSIKLWDPATGRQLRTLTEDVAVDAIAFSGDGKTLVSAGYVGVKLWDLNSGTVRRVVDYGSEITLGSVTLSADGKTLAGVDGKDIVLMGAAADANSYETTRYGQGLLTYALLTGIRGAALREEQYVDVALLFQYAADQVPQLAREIGGVQRPIVAAKQGTSFDVGLLKTKEERSAIPLALERPMLLRPSLINRDESVGFDDLELQPLLRERLREKSAGKGASAPNVWVGISINADDMTGAIRPSGTYLVVGDTVRVTMSLVRDGKRIDSFQVEGNKADKEGLVRLILEGIAKSMRTLAPPG